MYDPFHSLDELKKRVEEDKQNTGVGASTRNRYPIRFVLFDNFRDCYDFVEYLQLERGVQVESVDRWLEKDYPDYIITHVELAERISDYISKVSPNDSVIAPFSELARFYNNETKKSFDALLTTIKAKEASQEAVYNQQRIYVPVVGLEGKMDAFRDDSQITIWRLVSEEKDLNYRLILTDNKDFGVKGLENNYTIVNNIREWLNIWKNTKKQATPNIICKSRSIYANAAYAQPDNAFVYVTCHNAYEFLVHGLQLAFGGLQPLVSDGDNWDVLAKEIDLSEGFNFTKFVQNYFGVNDIEDHKDFIRLWFYNRSIFSRWLLARYYMSKQNDQGYLCRILRATTNYATNEFVEKMVCDIEGDSEDMAIRMYCLKYAAKENIQLSDAAEGMVSSMLEVLPIKIGYEAAIDFFSGISKKEKEIALNWFAQGKILAQDLRAFYPDLYHYVKEGLGISAPIPTWLDDYIFEYKKAKVVNTYTKEIEVFINDINSNESDFDKWYNKFKTTYTELMNRGDIEVFYWIDGLGIDWIPLIKEIVAERKEQMVFLNEIKIARSILPSLTEVNRKDLQRLMPDGVQLEKCGDLDALAHKSNNVCPFTLIKEIELVRKTIEEILNLYIGKKIAIISDHGLSYLPQIANGLNMAGVESEHHGRVAIRKKPSSTTDSSYFRLDDDKTLCALKHDSLCAKVPVNQGIHGGCTPEEVLVPIFIISGTPAATNWDATPLTLELSGANPKYKIDIKNLPSTDKPYIIYNGQEYSLHLVSGDTFESDALALDSNATTVTLCIGSVEKDYNVMISTGVQETDLFGF